MSKMIPKYEVAVLLLLIKQAFSDTGRQLFHRPQQNNNPSYSSAFFNHLNTHGVAVSGNIGVGIRYASGNNFNGQPANPSSQSTSNIYDRYVGTNFNIGTNLHLANNEQDQSGSTEANLKPARRSDTPPQQHDTFWDNLRKYVETIRARPCFADIRNDKFWNRFRKFFPYKPTNTEQTDIDENLLNNTETSTTTEPAPSLNETKSMEVIMQMVKALINNETMPEIDASPRLENITIEIDTENETHESLNSTNEDETANSIQDLPNSANEDDTPANILLESVNHTNIDDSVNSTLQVSPNTCNETDNLAIVNNTLLYYMFNNETHNLRVLDNETSDLVFNNRNASDYNNEESNTDLSDISLNSATTSHPKTEWSVKFPGLMEFLRKLRANVELNKGVNNETTTNDRVVSNTTWIKQMWNENDIRYFIRKGMTKLFRNYDNSTSTTDWINRLWFKVPDTYQNTFANRISNAFKNYMYRYSTTKLNYLK